MPYISQEAREKLSTLQIPDSPGELNYLISRMIDEYILRSKGREYFATYSLYNEVIGVLECVKLELYRRKVAPYEDCKIIENGDVYK